MTALSGDAEQWFRRYNGKAPEKGGARKSMTTRPKDWLEETRKEWADHANQALEQAGGAGSGFMKEPWISSTGTPWRAVTSSRPSG